MPEQFSRSALMFGEDGVMRLRRARVAVFGVGGVGGYVIEALARSGVGTLDITDNDTVSESNINRQIIALHSTVGRYKTDVMAERIRDICPDTVVNAHRCFFLPDTADQFDFSQYDYVVDAIDTVTGKLSIIEKAKAAGVPVISAMGAGNKLDPTALRVADISRTDTCPLARVIRYELRKRGIKRVKAVYSTELPSGSDSEEKTHSGRSVPASNAFVPSAMGLVIAGEVVKDLLK
ncbi:MAG: tRNA threonylcarbamoyladenosine dehydratase [Ruminococcus sp.]|nr:tRNA threonylcarbamoyladenosine dehydratase [Ruminococcus sp.]